jgi:hypothetical protein
MVIASVFALIGPCVGLALADDFIGQASVIDGDTLEIHGVRIRLWGVDAPESSQLCRDDDSKLYQCGSQADSIDIVEPSQGARPMALISLRGLSVEALHSTGRNIPKGRYGPTSGPQEQLRVASGKAAMSSRGCTACALARWHAACSDDANAHP